MRVSRTRCSNYRSAVHVAPKHAVTIGRSDNFDRKREKEEISQPVGRSVV
ncbi:uncharacterized protein J3R85_012310 [Psidium guajava]|nr:uncharacterized protein J3R85_012310 [Psidium guajava]